MKSMLHEASSVAQAIEKAWVESGRPEEFTINILEPGKKGLFGLITKRPAIVSITYDPKKISQRQDRATHHDRKMNQSRRQERLEDRKSGRQQSSHAPAQKESRSQVRDQKTTPRPSGQEGERATRQQDRPSLNNVNQRQEKSGFQADLWTPELAEQIKVWLQELCALMEISVQFTTHIDKKILHVTFQERIFSADDERALYMSLAYVLMQFLKKAHKKKFHNCHIVISTKGFGVHDKRTSSTPE